MPQVVPNAFTTLTFTPEEETEARTLTPLMRLWLINMRGEIALQKINLQYNPTDSLPYLQEEAALAGQLNLLNRLIGE